MKVNCEELPTVLRNICNGTARHSDGTPFSIEQRKEIISRRMRLPFSDVELPESKIEHRKNVSRIGTILKEIIEKFNGEHITCRDCKKDVERLNTLSSKEVLLSKAELARTITSRGAEKATKWYHRMAAKYAAEFVAKQIEGWIEDACRMNDAEDLETTPIQCGSIMEYSVSNFIEEVQEAILGAELTGNKRQILALHNNYELVKSKVIGWNGKKSLVWKYAVTTVPSRFETLKVSLESLKNAGFDRPILFVDDVYSDIYDFGLEVVFRGKNLKTYSHWLLTLSELYLRNPEADRYAIFQDDVIFMKDLREFLERSDYPNHGYLNLFSFLENEHLIKGKNGWLRSNQKGQGGLALVFDNNTALALLTQPHVYTRTWNRQRKDRFMDGGVVEAMTRTGRFEYIHSPSLVQHIGHTSSMGNPPHPQCLTFPGEISALTLL